MMHVTEVFFFLTVYFTFTSILQWILCSSNAIKICCQNLSIGLSISRYLKHLGYEVKYVRNFTDIDDKVRCFFTLSSWWLIITFLRCSRWWVCIVCLIFTWEIFFLSYYLLFHCFQTEVSVQFFCFMFLWWEIKLSVKRSFCHMVSHIFCIHGIQILIIDLVDGISFSCWRVEISTTLMLLLQLKISL